MEIKLNDSEFKALKEAVGKRIHGEVKELSFINDFIGLGVIRVSESDTPIHTYTINVPDGISEELFDILFGMTEKDTTKYVESAKDLAEEIKGVSELDVVKILDELLDPKNIIATINSCVTSDIDEDDREDLYEYHCDDTPEAKSFGEYIITSAIRDNIIRYLDTGTFMMLREMLDWGCWIGFDYRDPRNILAVKLDKYSDAEYVNPDIIIGFRVYKGDEIEYTITNFSSDANPYYNILKFIPYVAKWMRFQDWIRKNKRDKLFMDTLADMINSGVMEKVIV